MNDELRKKYMIVFCLGRTTQDRIIFKKITTNAIQAS